MASHSAAAVDNIFNTSPGDHSTNSSRARRDITSGSHPTEMIPLANPELDDLDDNRKTVSRPYPGIDDGFFDSTANSQRREENPDVESVPLGSKHDDSDLFSDDDIPVIISRAGGDGGSNPDETDPTKRPLNPEAPAKPRRFPNFLGFDLENQDGESIPDVNVYQHKKTLAQGMMDLALFSANANQLRYVLESSTRHPYYFPSVALISISLIFQVAVGAGLIWNATYNVKDEKEICVANKINNFTVIGIFLVTVINVFISAFGVGAPTAAT